jgi:putative SOS response-associated peptidase YedK
MAGIYSRREAGGRSARDTFAILTTRPNALVARTHDRMPVLLLPEFEAAWLDPALAFSSLDPGLFEPMGSDGMIAYEVGPAVHRAAFDGPECWTPAGPPSRDLFGEEW